MRHLNLNDFLGQRIFFYSKELFMAKNCLKRGGKIAYKRSLS